MPHKNLFHSKTVYKVSIKLLLGILLIQLPWNCFAIDIGEKAEIHGFASLGYINSDHNPFYGDTLDGSFEFQEVAINGLWETSDTLRLSGQLLYRNTGTISQKHINIDFLMADFRLAEQESNISGVRLGRVKIPYGLYNSSRDVPHGRPGIFVPKSVYFDSFRDAMLAVDGAGIYGNLYNDWGNFDLQMYAGRSDINNNSMEHYLFSSDIQGSFDHANLKGLQMLIEPSGVPGFKFGYSLFNVDMRLNDGSTHSAQQLGQNYALQYLYGSAANPFSPTSQEISAAQSYAQQEVTKELTGNYRAYLNDVELKAYMHVVSLQYFWKQITLTGEYVWVNSELTQNLAETGFQSNSTTSEGYYLQLEWQAMDKLTLLARYERLYLDTSDKDGSKGFDSGFLVSPFTHYAKGYTLGARWYFSGDISITAEYAHSTGAAWLPKDDEIDASQLNEDWDYWAIQVSYHF